MLEQMAAEKLERVGEALTPETKEKMIRLERENEKLLAQVTGSTPVLFLQLYPSP